MQVLAINWYVLQQTGSAAHMGATVMLQALPTLLLTPWAGALADRLPGRPVLVGTQFAHAALATALAAIAWSPGGHVPAIYIISLLAGLIGAFEGPVMGRFNATVVGPAALTNAVSLGSLINSTGRIVGMSLGGVLVAGIGPAPLFAANAVSFTVAIGALVAIRPTRLHPLERPAKETATVRHGITYLLRQPIVLITLGLVLVLSGLGRNYQVTMAAMSDGPLAAGARGYGLLSAVFALGAVLGGLAAARRPALTYRTLIGAGVLTSALQLTAGLAPGLWTFAAAIVPIAAGCVLIDTTVSARVQLDTDGHMRGRVLAAATMAGAAATSVGAPLLGWLAEQLGPRETLVLAGAIAGLVCAATGLVMARRRQIPVNQREVRTTLRAAVL